jgi:hypothetical protein
VKPALFAITKSKDVNPSREKLQRSFQQGRQDQQCSVSTLEAIVSTIIILLMICTNINNLPSTASLCQRLRRVTTLNAEDLGQRTPTNIIVYYHQLDHLGRRTANQKETTSSALWVVGERRPISDAPTFDPNISLLQPAHPPSCQRLRRVTTLNAEDLGQRTPTNIIVYYHQLDHLGRRTANQKETTSSALWVVGERRPISDAPAFDPNQIFDSSPHQRLHFLDLPKLFQVWKPAPATLKQDPSTHLSISSTAVLASLIEASPGNLKKTMMGAAGRQQHVFRCLGNQICDSPPHQRPHFLDLPKLFQVWKPAPATLKQDPSTHLSISSTAVLASLVEASPGNLKKTMVGAAGRQQHVFRCLGNQICDNPPHQHPHSLQTPHHSQPHHAKTA